MNQQNTIGAIAVAALLSLGGACTGKTSAAQEQLNHGDATLRECGSFSTPGGKSVQAYAVSMTSQAGENLLLVVGSSATVSAVDASTVKIGDKTTENLRWAGSCGQIVAVNGDAKVVVSGLGDKLGTTGWRPAKPEEAYKFPLQLLKPVLSGKTLKLPELDNIPAQ